MDAFRDALTRHLGQPVVRRYSGGADIQAACGTLAGAGLRYYINRIDADLEIIEEKPS